MLGSAAFSLFPHILSDASHTTVSEVNRPDRSVRYRKVKSDSTDAEMATRANLSSLNTGSNWIKQASEELY